MRDNAKIRPFVLAATTLAILTLAFFPASVRAPPAPSTASTCTGCSIGLVAPSADSTVPSTFYVSFFVKNFSIVNPGSQVYTSAINNQGHLHIFLDNNYYTLWAQASAIPFLNIAAGSHTFRLQLVNDTHAPFSPDVNFSRTVTVNDAISSSVSSAQSSASNAATFGIAATVLSLIAVIISALVFMKVSKIKTP